MLVHRFDMIGLVLERTFVVLYGLGLFAGVLYVSRNPAPIDGNSVGSPSLVGIPAFTTTMSSFYLLNIVLRMGRWGSFTASIGWFGLVAGFLNKQLPFENRTCTDRVKLFIVVLQIGILCLLFVATDYATHSSPDVEDVLILVGIGLPLCCVGYIFGALSQPNDHTDVPRTRPERGGRTFVAIRAVVLLGHVFLTLAWQRLFSQGQATPTWFLQTIYSCYGFLYAVLVSKLYRCWKPIVLHVICAYSIFAILLRPFEPERYLSDAFFVYLPILQLSFWIWFKRST